MKNADALTEQAKTGRKGHRKPPTPLHALITGVPGFIGRRLARRLLADNRRAVLTVIVRQQALERAGAWRQTLPPAHKRRVEILSGDVALMDLGLSGPEAERLAATVTHFFHLASLQFVGASAVDARRVNVGGTQNALDLAGEMPKLERFVHFSTCFVSGDRPGVITEQELDERQGFRNAYERTKFEAEKRVRRQDRVPWSIMRPSIVVGDSETGEIDQLTGVHALGLLLVASPAALPLPFPGDGHAPLHLVPVDYVTRAALALVARADAVHQTYHLVDPNPLSGRHVHELIAKRSGRRVPRIPFGYGVAKRLLRMPVVEKYGRVQMQALDYLNHFAVYNCSGALAGLEGSQVSCPRIDSYVDKLMSYATHIAEKKGKRAIAEALGWRDLS